MFLIFIAALKSNTALFREVKEAAGCHLVLALKGFFCWKAFPRIRASPEPALALLRSDWKAPISKDYPDCISIRFANRTRMILRRPLQRAMKNPATSRARINLPISTWAGVTGSPSLYTDRDRLIRLVRETKERDHIDVWLEPGEAIAIHTGLLRATVMDVYPVDSVSSCGAKLTATLKSRLSISHGLHTMPRKRLADSRSSSS